MPFSQGLTYVAADALLPDSKFILSERPADSWFNSVCNFHKKVFGLDDLSTLTEKDALEKFIYLYPGFYHSNMKRILSTFNKNIMNVNWDKLHAADWYIDMYTRRNEEIKRYFMNAPDKLLVVDVTAEDTTTKICNFVNIPSAYVISMPHRNKT